jgi:hypothetical protein
MPFLLQRMTLRSAFSFILLLGIAAAAQAQSGDTAIIDRKDIPPAVTAQVACGTEPESITRRPFAGGFVFAWNCPGNNANYIQALVFAARESGEGATLLRFPQARRKGEAIEELSNIRWDAKARIVSQLFVDPESSICRSEARWRLDGTPPVPVLIHWRETRDCTGKRGWKVLVSSTNAAPRGTEAPLTCAGPFARNAMHASLVKAFGKSNVVLRDVGIGEGETVKASVIFPRDKARHIEVLWISEKARRNPSEIRVGDGSAWRTTHGVAAKMSLAEVEALNGKPFRLYGFGFDYGGTVLDWEGGRLAARDGGCTLSLRFTMREAADNSGIYGEERSFMSDDAAMSRAAPVVEAISLRFAD